MEIDGHTTHPSLAGLPAGGVVCLTQAASAQRDLIALCDEAISGTCAKPHRLPSGPLHDASEVARAGIPTVMMFVQSLHGISHNKLEDTREEHLQRAVGAFDELAGKTMQWITAR